ncbi:MAG: hypothetical protein Q8921_02095 [Bacteroidota bacterium]|nr:hypothetical protein [Bacteroidota bacterium]MDP4241509.1 hypothetical protein [Bacteroidota bacterium]
MCRPELLVIWYTKSATLLVQYFGPGPALCAAPNCEGAFSAACFPAPPHFPPQPQAPPFWQECADWLGAEAGATACLGVMPMESRLSNQPVTNGGAKAFVTLLTCGITVGAPVGTLARALAGALKIGGNSKNDGAA